MERVQIFSLVEGLEIEFYGKFSSRGSSLMQSIAETCVCFDAAHLSINLVLEIGVPMFPTLSCDMCMKEGINEESNLRPINLKKNSIVRYPNRVERSSAMGGDYCWCSLLSSESCTCHEPMSSLLIPINY